MTTPEQLTFGGGSVPYPIPEPPTLTTRQRELLLVLRAHPDGMSTAQLRRLYADPNGVIRRLRRLGLVRRIGRGRWAAA